MAFDDKAYMAAKARKLKSFFGLLKGGKIKGMRFRTETAQEHAKRLSRKVNSRAKKFWQEGGEYTGKRKAMGKTWDRRRELVKYAAMGYTSGKYKA